ncbi:MAG TPA: BON domain-containing protein [Candidatus Acidoferrales bacterium]|jgi:hyperosmotically inducible protein|nr:BON domain-containing protein [Candidatus Acidoferrales bacterium]
MIRPSSSGVRRALVSTFAFLLLLPAASAVFAANTAQAPARDSSNYQAWLTKEVRHQLLLLPFCSVFDNLEYRIEGSKVVLMGQVVRPVLKSDAEGAVKRIEGVTAVDNQIKVLPPAPMDDRIRHAEYRAIYGSPTLQMYQDRSVAPIHIIVDNGHVTLEGVVSTQNDKNIAGLMANKVPNVFSVTNNLRVEKS